MILKNLLIEYINFRKPITGLQYIFDIMIRLSFLCFKKIFSISLYYYKSFIVVIFVVVFFEEVVERQTIIFWSFDYFLVKIK